MNCINSALDLALGKERKKKVFNLWVSNKWFMQLNGGLKSSQVNFFSLSQDKYSEFAFELLFFHALEHNGAKTNLKWRWYCFWPCDFMKDFELFPFSNIEIPRKTSQRLHTVYNWFWNSLKEK
jgi:hypothetical protein